MQIREALNCAMSVFHSLCGELLQECEEQIDGLMALVLRVSRKVFRAPTGLQCAPVGLYKLVNVHSGALQYWVILPARQGW
jgi:hypothetical protein